MVSPIRPAIMDYGDRALLLECASGDGVLALTDAVRDAQLPGVVDIVPAARTVLVTLGDPALQVTTRSRLAAIEIIAPDRQAADHGPRVVIDVVYDGADLAVVAGHLGMTVEEVVDAHTRTPWRVGFCGFAPGFAYLIDGDPRLNVPRRVEPRSRVPAGSVALAGAFSGVYPRDSPGGWQLIGRTDTVLWDINRSQPALLTPGTWVQFRARAAR
jgi:KipI family sensor histidine kinase inhibitor